MIFTIAKYLDNVDDTAYTTEMSFIVAEMPDGTCFRHVATFPNAAQIHIDVDVSDIARLAVQDLLDNIESQQLTSPNQLNREQWIEIAPRYNSVAFKTLNVDAVYRELERQDIVCD